MSHGFSVLLPQLIFTLSLTALIINPLFVKSIAPSDCSMAHWMYRFSKSRACGSLEKKRLIITNSSDYDSRIPLWSIEQTNSNELSFDVYMPVRKLEFMVSSADLSSLHYNAADNDVTEGLRPGCGTSVRHSQGALASVRTTNIFCARNDSMTQ